jgi:hypothetical protein
MNAVCHKCPWWNQLRGKHPQTGAEVDEWACSISWLPMLMVETAKEVRQGAAATESFRNEVAKVGERLTGIAQQRTAQIDRK